MQGVGAGFALYFTLSPLNYVILWLFLLAVDVQSLSHLTSFLSCRLIALNKWPGVWLIEVCEVARKIIAKVSLSIIQRVAGPYQLCTGQVTGIEFAVRSAFLKRTAMLSF